MKIIFTRTVTVQAADGPTFTAGQTYDLPDDSCHHWTSRGIAEVVADEPAIETATHEPPVEVAAKRITKRVTKRAAKPKH